MHYFVFYFLFFFSSITDWLHKSMILDTSDCHILYLKTASLYVSDTADVAITISKVIFAKLEIMR